LGQTVERAIDELKQFGGQARILADDVGHLGGRAGGRIEHLPDFEIDVGKRGQLDFAGNDILGPAFGAEEKIAHGFGPGTGRDVLGQALAGGQPLGQADGGQGIEGLDGGMDGIVGEKILADLGFALGEQDRVRRRFGSGVGGLDDVGPGHAASAQAFQVAVGQHRALWQQHLAVGTGEVLRQDHARL